LEGAGLTLVHKIKFMLTTERVAGFDLARAYAILGMFIVNFNVVFGNYTDTSPGAKFLALFSGNSSTLFVMLAGMGVSFSTRTKINTIAERRMIRQKLLRRSWLLFALGLLLFLWWPADILHFYGAYMHIAALLIFMNRKYYLLAAALAIVVFHLLLTVIPYEAGWDFQTLMYTDFWTWHGFLRNTFYNGWNPVFPWFAFFAIGMYLGKLNWQDTAMRKRIFWIGLGTYVFTYLLQSLAENSQWDAGLKTYLVADYLPPFLPFMLGGMGLGLVILVICIVLGEQLAHTRFLNAMVKTGQMTLTHYISHVTLGIIVFYLIFEGRFPSEMIKGGVFSPWCILLFSMSYFLLSILFSIFWSRKFKHGPFELLLRRLNN
jgi:uncharacterized protein